MVIRRAIKWICPAPLWNLGRRIVHGTWFQETGIRAAIRQQGLTRMFRFCEEVVPDLTDQYTSFRLDTPFLRLKVRGLHAFQMELVNQTVRLRDDTIIDIGDSSGNHTRYIERFCAMASHYPYIRSVTWDPVAVGRIRAKGMSTMALDVEATVFATSHFCADVALCFEILEHLRNPVGFLRRVSTAKKIILTVPWVRQSRVAARTGTGPEDTHVFELSPEDWRALFRYTGWRVVREQIYRQYPVRHPLRLLRGWWRRRDYEGFYGAVLQSEKA